MNASAEQRAAVDDKIAAHLSTQVPQSAIALARKAGVMRSEARSALRRLRMRNRAVPHYRRENDAVLWLAPAVTS